ncbi:MAG: anti-sigma-V factor rsiV [Lachnospiraceae bacterium]|nr:anti-sigma-V factor rsiV [Lachnospiraceae bacterium]
MEDKKLEALKEDYKNIPIPDELDFVVKKALKEGKRDMMNNRKNRFKGLRILAATAAASFVVIVAGANTSQAFAETLQEVPVLGGIVKVLTFRVYSVDEDNYSAKIEVPKVEGLDNEQLQNSLNEKYLKENKKLYEEFMADIKDIEEVGEGHLAVNSGYEILADNDIIFSIKRYVETTKASTNVENKFDTVDKKNQVLITLPSLFKDESYVNTISDEIRKQMEEQVKSDSDKVYWLDDEELMPEDLFQKIDKEQRFYINSEGKLVICFNKYEVAPGYMGTPEFVIPTEVIRDLLAGTDYIK